MSKRLVIAAVAAAALLVPGSAAAADIPSTVAADSSSPSPAPVTTPLERVSAYTTPSIVYIGTEWSGRVYDRYNKRYLNDGLPFYFSFQCTGYVVNSDGYIATAGHCVDPDEVRPLFFRDAAQWALDNGYYLSTDLTLDDVLAFDDYVVVAPEGSKRVPRLDVTAAWSVSAGGVETGKALPARVVKWRPFGQGDGALLKVEATNLNAIPLATKDLEIGTEIVAIGYPGSVDLVTDATFSPSFKDGAVSSRKTVSGGLLTVYEISAAVSGGMSGGPTVNLDSEVVGFNSFGINSAIETQQFNFVRPTSSVVELLGDAGAGNDLSEDSASYRAGLDAYFAGDKATAVAELQSVVDSQPTHELAKQYLEKAKDLPDPPKKVESSGTSLLPWLLGGGAVVAALLVIGAFVLVRRSRRRASMTPTYAVMPAMPSMPAQAYPPQPPPTGIPPVPPAPAVTAGTATTIRAGTPRSPVPEGPTDAESVFCPECGTKHGPHQKFCTHCGVPL
jgi:S1-C subfamily serine protease